MLWKTLWQEPANPLKIRVYKISAPKVGPRETQDIGVGIVAYHNAHPNSVFVGGKCQALAQRSKLFSIRVVRRPVSLSQVR